jgi:acetyl-CoA acetyltransferase
MSGTQDIVIAGGVEQMTRVPMGSNMPKTLGMPNDDSIKARYNTSAPAFSQFVGAEMMGVKYGIGREEMDIFAARSHRRAAEATEAGRFVDEITAVPGLDKEGGEVRGGGDRSELWNDRVEATRLPGLM